MCFTDARSIGQGPSDFINKKYRVVNPKNVLWTCHKTCKIEFADCSYCVCSICYAKETLNVDTNQNTSGKNSRKRRRTSKNKDDDQTICNHSIDQLVPFMDSKFFTQKYKCTIRQEKYVLPMFCSVCKCELVDKVNNIEPQQNNTTVVAV